MNELEMIEKQNDVTYEVPAVNFPAYEEYKEKATTIAAYIDGMTVDESNIKETKQTLAKARKLTDRLSRIRIDMKKDLLRNYTVFESQVKEIANIVDRADSDLRVKVRELEEAERRRKEIAIHDIWERRVAPYPLIEKVVPAAFDYFIQPKHLNKTTTLKSVESDMAVWIDKTYNEMLTAQSMGTEYLAMYAWKMDLAEAISEVNAEKERVAAAERANLEEGGEKEKETFVVYGKKDIELTTMLLNDHEINYMIY